MKQMMKLGLFGFLVLLVVGGNVQAGDLNRTITEALQKAVQAPNRTPANRLRDKWRHPVETLSFFGVRPDMTVVEIWPGGGWYTEILAPYLREHGRLIAAGFDPDSKVAYYRKNAKKFAEKMASSPIYDRVQIAVFDPMSDAPILEHGVADRVLTFRNVHNWTRGGDDRVVSAFKRFYNVLKPGGILGVVEHRLPENRPDADQGPTGYMKQSYVIRMAEKAGFRLEATSEINANPKDNADHPKGVWTLPPVLRLGDKDKDKYLAIGESDRMTLRFVKPAHP